MRSGEGSLSGFSLGAFGHAQGSKINRIQNTTIVAGTGLGKSYGFQLGVMISLVHARMIEETINPVQFTQCSFIPGLRSYWIRETAS